ncbi:MAG: LysM peptidoglycan-binding domain-containing protein [Nitrospiria bacterium]
MAKRSYQFKRILSFLFLTLFFSSAGHAQDVPGTEYIVKKGDTLWGITSSNYNDPFLWPKLWGKNPTLPHPDKIYPGMKIFLPSEEYLKEIEKSTVGKGETMAAAAPKPEIEPSSQKQELVKAEIEERQPDLEENVKKDENERMQPLEPDSAVENRKIPAWSVSDLISAGYILKNNSDSDTKGIIVASENEHLLLGEGDVVYIVPKDSQKFNVGERYTIFGPIKSVHHPKTKRLIGKLIHTKGIVEIIQNSMASPKDSYSALIVKSYELISLKDLITTYHPIDPINVVLNESPYPKNLKGLVIASKEIKENNGEHDIVYLDKGSQDGVQPGHLLVVFKEGKKAQYYSPSGIGSLPRRVIADLEVISVEKETSTAIVARSSEPIAVGDRFSNPPSNP